MKWTFGSMSEGHCTWIAWKSWKIDKCVGKRWARLEKGRQGVIVLILTWKQLEEDLTFIFQRQHIEPGNSQQGRQGKFPLILQIISTI